MRDQTQQSCETVRNGRTDWYLGMTFISHLFLAGASKDLGLLKKVKFSEISFGQRCCFPSMRSVFQVKVSEIRFKSTNCCIGCPHNLELDAVS